MTQQPWGQQWPAAGQSGHPQQWPAASQPGYPQQWAAPHGGYQRTGQYPAQAYPQQTAPQYRQVPQYPQGYQVRTYPTPQPPRRGGGGVRIALLSLFVVVTLGFFLLALVGFVLGGEEETTPTPQPSTSVTTVPSEPIDVPDPDYDPPELPLPETYGEAEDWLVDNAVYQADTTSVACPLTGIDPATASVDELEDHLDSLVACLMAVWKPPIEAEGFLLPRPPVSVYTTPVTTGCGKLDDLYNAVYCGADQRIYYGQKVYQVFPEEIVETPFMIDLIIGHEFGHAIQARAGIIVSAQALGQKAGEDEALVFDRRVELQADCLSGMFITSVAQASGIDASATDALGEIAYNLGDDTLSGKPDYVGGHGTGKARERWFDEGMETTTVATCNTFTVSDSKVR